MRCPRCGTLLATSELHCPECGLGFQPGERPGVRIAIAPRGEVLCEHCAYREECNLPDFPEARRCTLYRDERAPTEMPMYQSPMSRNLWSVPLLFAALILISLLLALVKLPA